MEVDHAVKTWGRINIIFPKSVAVFPICHGMSTAERSQWYCVNVFMDISKRISERATANINAPVIA